MTLGSLVWSEMTCKNGFERFEIQEALNPAEPGSTEDYSIPTGVAHFVTPPPESELWKWLRGNSDCMLLAFLCFLAPFPLTTCDVSHVCPLSLALEKCHLGLNRPSSWRLWQSARLKGHAPIGIGSPGCAASGCCWLRSSPRYVISILKTGKTASTPFQCSIFLPHPYFSLRTSEPECFLKLSWEFMCRFLFLMFLEGRIKISVFKVWTPSKNLQKKSYFVESVSFIFFNRMFAGLLLGATTVAIDALMECSLNAVCRLTAILIACLTSSRAVS